MTLLPVVERELRVGARGNATYRIRFAAALLTIGFSILSLWFVPVFLDDQPIPPRELFLFLAWIEYLFLLVAGFTLTCDAVSQEKRDATLGLLFLTDLKGYDITLGKLCAAGLRGIYAFLATIPVLALPVMLGGTNLTELAATSLTLLIALFFSMAVGLAASVFMRRNWTSFGVAGFVMIVFALVLPLLAELARSFYMQPRLGHFLELPSPSYALLTSFRIGFWMGGRDFAISLALIAGLGIFALLMAALVIPHVWKDRPAARRMAALIQFGRNLKFGARNVRDQFRRKLLDRNPIFWLSRRERVSSLGLLLTIVAAGATAGWFASRDWSTTGWQGNVIVPFIAWVICGSAVHLIILLRLATIAAERFGEDRRSGALELTLSTPISIKEVLAGHWMGLARYFAGPLVIALGIHMLALFLFLNVQYLHERQVLSLWELIAGVWSHLFYVPLESYAWEFQLGVLLFLGSIPLLMLDWVVLAWLSTWLSLRVKVALAAPLAALVLLHVPPWFALGLVGLFLDKYNLFPSNNFSEVLVVYGLGAVLILTHQLLCLGWSRRQLYRHFRTAATDRYQPLTERGWRAVWKRLRMKYGTPAESLSPSQPEVATPS